MKKFELKLTGFIIALIIIALILPTQVLGANYESEILKSGEDYLIYVKDLAETEFDFAISTQENANDIDLDYVNSIQDSVGNQVAFVKAAKYEEIASSEHKYIYIKTSESEEATCQELNFEKTFDQAALSEVENITKIIKTEAKDNLNSTTQEVDGVRITTTVGGLVIIDEDATYYYAMTKLPAQDYTELMELAEKLNSEYETMDMYTRIETAAKFYNLYNELAEKQNWESVENKTILQPEDAKEGEQYVVFLKKVNGEDTTIDVKLLTSKRVVDEGKDEDQTTTTQIKETTKLPITGDNIALFVALLAIVIAAIIVFAKIKKEQEKESNK